MIWLVNTIDQAFIEGFSHAGEPDQRVIDAFLSQKRVPSHPVKNQGKRWYYLVKDNPRISMVTLGRPLDDWVGSAKMIIGTREIIGEFSGNAPFVGQRGLQLKVEPGEWLQGQPDRRFNLASEILPEISEQILDKRSIDAIQEQIKKLYQW